MDGNILPQGDRLRQFLTRPSITNSTITSLLREKGVFLGVGDKNSSIPSLMKTLISPPEYHQLCESLKSKEDTVKIKTATIRCREELDLLEVFPADFDLQKRIIESHKYKPTFKLIGSPSPYLEEGSVIFEYRIERDNLLEDWTSNKSYHNGAIIVSRSSDGDIELSVEQNSTSKETLSINDLITREIRNSLKDRDLINDGEDFIRIKFNDFNNSSRIQFLYSFMSDFCIYLEFVSITDINLFLDENEESHEDVKMFLDEIEALKLNGKVLQNHLLLRTSKYFPKLIFAAISLKYRFNVEGVKGACTLDIAFPDYVSRQDPSSELQVSINFNISREQRKFTNETYLRKKLYKFIERKKIESYEKHKSF